MKSNLLLAAIVLMFAPVYSSADVTDSSATGFTVKMTYTIQAPPADVYKRFVRNIGDWWDSQHTFSQDAHNLSIEEKPMGCFCEKLANQGGVRHMEVVYVAPGKGLVMIGALGPLQSQGMAGSMTLEFAPAEGGTKLSMSYSVGGYAAAGMNTWGAPVDSMLKAQFTRFKNYVEHGNPTQTK
jgi:uncharacterized protein YndB with AHSA1/START domain